MNVRADLLAGRTAVVTGGGGGIGRGISELFAANGAKVVVAEIEEARAAETVAAIAAAGGDAVGEVVDVRDRVQVEAMGERVGSVDVLVNNVGHYLDGRGSFLDSDEAEWDALYRVNLHHVFLCTQVFAPAMVSSGRGSIVNLSTVEAFRGIPSRAVYSAFKAAITGFTTLSLRNSVVPRTVRAVWLAELRMGLTSSRSKAIRLCNWRIKTTRASPMRPVASARMMIVMSRSVAVNVGCVARP